MGINWQAMWDMVGWPIAALVVVGAVVIGLYEAGARVIKLRKRH